MKHTEALKKMYQLLLTEPHAPTVCAQLEEIAIEALAQPEQEPVAYIRVSKTGNVMACAKTGDFYNLPDKTLLYTTPPQRKPLTDEEIYDMYNEPRSDAEMIAFARAIEAAHGIGEKK